MIRAMDRDTLFVSGELGEPVEVRIQGFQLRADVGGNGAEFKLPPLFFGNRREIMGTIWRGKVPERLKVEKR